MWFTYIDTPGQIDTEVHGQMSKSNNYVINIF